MSVTDDIEVWRSLISGRWISLGEWKLFFETSGLSPNMPPGIRTIRNNFTEGAHVVVMEPDWRRTRNYLVRVNSPQLALFDAALVQHTLYEADEDEE